MASPSLWRALLNPSNGFFWPDVLPGGKGVLFTNYIAPGNVRLAVFSRATGKVSDLGPAGSHARYVETGHIVYAAGGTLRAAGFDQNRLALTSDPVPVVEGALVNGNFERGLVRDRRERVTGLSGGRVVRWAPRRPLVWVDRKGRSEESASRRTTTGGRASRRMGSVWPSMSRNNRSSIWVVNPARGNTNPLELGHELPSSRPSGHPTESSWCTAPTATAFWVSTGRRRTGPARKSIS